MVIFSLKKKGPLSLLLSTIASSSTFHSQLLARPKTSWKQSTHRKISQATLKSNPKNLASETVFPNSSILYCCYNNNLYMST